MKAHPQGGGIQISSENMHSSNSMSTQHILFRNIYEYINAYMHAITINEKWDQKFEGDWEGV